MWILTRFFLDGEFFCIFLVEILDFRYELWCAASQSSRRIGRGKVVRELFLNDRDRSKCNIEHCWAARELADPNISVTAEIHEVIKQAIDALLRTNDRYSNNS